MNEKNKTKEKKMKALQGMLTGWSIYNIIILLICIANIVIQIRIGIIEENWNISAICGWTGATIAYIQLIWFTNFYKYAI